MILSSGSTDGIITDTKHLKDSIKQNLPPYGAGGQSLWMVSKRIIGSGLS
jgi:hypothetical protein